MSFFLQIEDRYRQGISFGDWIIETPKPGQWTIGWDYNDVPDDFPTFSDVYELVGAGVEA
jgi:hypothetical protein